MKISFINSSYYNSKGLVTKTNENTKCTLLCVDTPNSKGVVFASKVTSSDSVSFKSSPVKPYIDDMRNLPDLPCACCGKKMLPNKKVNEFLNKKVYYPANISLQRIKTEHYFKESKASDEMKEAYSYLKSYAALHPKLTMSDILSKPEVKDRRSMDPKVSAAFDELREMTKLVAHNSKYMVEELTKLSPDFHKIEKKVFKELQRLAHDYPNETFYDILNKPKVKDVYLKKLQTKQLSILDKIEFACEDAPPELKQTVLNITDSAREIFTQEDPEILHKRRRVMSKYESALFEIKDNPYAQEILYIVNQLPDSKTDMDAFMIRAAKKSSNAIIEILLSRQRNSFEHVKPHRRVGDNGESNIYNYIGLCGKCNSERERTPYDIFIQKHPEMIKNAQSQMDKIIYFINKGILTGYDNYPENIKKALNTESKDAIKVDIKKLNLEQARTNRKLRQDAYIAYQKLEQKKPMIYKFGKGLFIKKTEK